MNSYNENLRSSVVSSLNDQELELKKTTASLNAAMFSLYYAEGARITAAEKLEVISKTYSKQQKIQEQIVENNNLSVNLLAATNQEKTYVAKAVSNAAVGASNVQVAANAILNLASDVGSIFSIVNAADFDSQIYDQALDASKYMNSTAYAAEVASQYAMEGSMLTSKVSAETVAQEATATNASVKTMLDTLTAQFEATVEVMAADNAALAKASEVEKKAEGELGDINVEHYATRSAYLLSNDELNINLEVPLNTPKEKDNRSNIFYRVTFAPLESPFAVKGTKPGYPVENYYIMLVKNMNKSTFTITSAEALLLNPDQYVEVDPILPKGKDSFSEKIFISQLKDSDGDDMDLGAEYVVFVFAKLSEKYKKALNNFDDYLSASSPVFSLVNKLNAPKASSFKYKHHDREIEFSLEQNKSYKVEYRLMLLPDKRELVQGLLTEQGVRSIEREVEKLEKIAEMYDPKILALTQEINTLQVRINAMPAQIEVLEGELVSAKTKKEKDAIIKKIEDLETQLKIDTAVLKQTKKELRKTKADKKKAEKAINPNEYMKPGFLFNLTLANQVPAGSYHALTNKEITIKPEKDDMVKVSAKVKIHEDMTDNFGNKLIDDVEYVPAVLAFSKEGEEQAGQFVNALSNFVVTEPIKYKSK